MFNLNFKINILIVLTTIISISSCNAKGETTSTEALDNLKDKMQEMLANENSKFEDFCAFLHKEVEPLAENGNVEAAKMLVPYLNPESEPEFASKIHNLAFSDLGEESYVETALWLYTVNPIYGTWWAVQCIKEGYHHPRLYTLLSRAKEHGILEDKELNAIVTIRDAANGNVASMYTLVGELIHKKDLDGAKELLLRIADSSSKEGGYDSVLDNCLYYTAPMTLSAHNFAGRINAYKAYADSVAPFYIKNPYWIPDGEPELRIKVYKELGYLYTAEGNLDEGLNNLNKACKWDTNIAMEYFQNFADHTPEMGIKLLQTAADNGSKQCALQLGLVYSDERYVKKHPSLSLKYAQQGFDPDDDSGIGEFVMACALQANGKKREADNWMKKSAAKGYRDAELVMRMLAR